MLFKVEPNKDVFSLNPQAKAIEEFSHMTSKMFTCLILYADYKSPLRQKPPADRFRLAAIQAGYKVDSHHQTQLEKRARELFAGDNVYWEAGLKKYMEIQHDEDREYLSMIDQQIENIRSMLKTATDDEAQIKKRNEILSGLPGLIETKRKLSRILDMEEEIMGNTESETNGEPRKLSLVDKLNEELQADTGD